MATTTATATPRSAKPKPPFYRRFGFQIIVALILGIVLGLVARSIGTDASGAAN